MKSDDRPQTIILWIIGALGVLVALALVALLVWWVFFRSQAPMLLAMIPTVPVEGYPSAPAVTSIPPSATTEPPSPTHSSSATRPSTETAPPVTVVLVPDVTATDTPAGNPEAGATQTRLSPYGTVQTEAANIRTGPGMQYPVMTQVSRGERLYLLGRDRHTYWLEVELADGRVGWIATYLVSAGAAYDLREVHTPQATPVPATASPLPSTSTPTPIATSTPTPKAIVTTGPPPTSTPTVAPCKVEVGAPFVGTWQAGAQTVLGCPVSPSVETWTGVQHFQNGMMLWREDQRMTYVLLSDQTWRKLVDGWAEGMPEYSCISAPPQGFLQPRRGFGLVWCSDSAIRSQLGWATEEEHGIVIQYQTFERGEMLVDDVSRIVTLVADGFWQYQP